MKTKNANKVNPADIPGWGMDADPENEPTYPMKNYTGDDHKRLDYERSEQQPVDVELLMSTERPTMTAVFGTSTPPGGVSGMIRRYAFTHSEDRYRHWLPLLLADRINVCEGILDDLVHGHIPDLFSEGGLRSEWRYNRRALLTKAVVTTAVMIALGSFIFRKKRP